MVMIDHSIRDPSIMIVSITRRKLKGRANFPSITASSFPNRKGQATPEIAYADIVRIRATSKNLLGLIGTYRPSD